MQPPWLPIGYREGGDIEKAISPPKPPKNSPTNVQSSTERVPGQKHSNITPAQPTMMRY